MYQTVDSLRPKFRPKYTGPLTATQVQPNKIHHSPPRQFKRPHIEIPYLYGDDTPDSRRGPFRWRRSLVLEKGSEDTARRIRFVERLATDDALHRIAISQSSCLGTFVTVIRSSLSLRRRRRSLTLVTMTTAFVRRIM